VDLALGLVHELDGVGQQVLEDLDEAGSFARDGRQVGIDRDPDVRRRRDGVENRRHQLVQIHRHHVLLDPPEPRVL
jgi:hypothetical protein